MAREFDELLWTYRQGSFVPHDLLTSEMTQPMAPVTIGHGDPIEPSGNLLINLADDIPAFFDRYERVAEIVDATPNGRSAGRDRFSFYRDNGFQPHTHKIG